MCEWFLVLLYHCIIAFPFSVCLSVCTHADDPSAALKTLSALEKRYSDMMRSSAAEASKDTTASSTSADTVIDNGNPSSILRSALMLPGGGRLQNAKLLYAKVMTVLMRVNRTDDAKNLLPILQAKNLTLEANQVHFFINQEARSNNYRGALEVFNTYFPAMDTKCPDARAVGVLVPLLGRLNDPAVCAEFARKLLPHANELGRLLQPSVCDLLSRYALCEPDVDAAVTYLSKIPYKARKLASFGAVAKVSAMQTRSDAILKLVELAPQPWPELIALAIAGLSLHNKPTQALAYEKLLNEVMEKKGKGVPWVFTFLLNSAAYRGYREVARRLISSMQGRWNIVPSELDYNLALMTHMRGALVKCK